MTSPPDVQNVPDIWTLLQKAHEELAVYKAEGGSSSFRKHPFLLGKIEDALRRRDRFVLVPMEPTQAMVDAAYEARNKGVDIGESIYYHMIKAMIAAAPCPRHDPCERDAGGYCAGCHSKGYP